MSARIFHGVVVMMLVGFSCGSHKRFSTLKDSSMQEMILDAGQESEEISDAETIDSSIFDAPLEQAIEASVDTNPDSDSVDSNVKVDAIEEDPRCAGITPSSNGYLCICNSNCLSGFCSKGRCCNIACLGACMACNNYSGICSLAQEGTPCNSGGTCDNKGQCSLPPTDENFSDK